MTTARLRLLLIGVSVVVAALAVASLLIGGYDITLHGLLTDPAAREMFLISRVPRTLAIVFAAAAMSISGVLMQMITQNKFVEPTTAGTSQWAGLGVLFGLIVLPDAAPLVKMTVATGFALVGTVVFMTAIRRIGTRSSVLVPLVGIMLGAVVSALTTFVAAETDLLQSMSAWQSGGFSGIVRGFYEPLWAVLAIAVAAFALADRFTVAGLGRDIATNVGVNYGAVVALGVTMVALSAGVTSVVVGFLPFLGLIVPNLVSLVLGDDVRRNLPWVAVTAAGLVLVCDLIGRTVVAPMEIPASVILGVVGAALFIAIVVRQRRVIGG